MFFQIRFSFISCISFCSVSFHCFYDILLLRRSCNYQMKIYMFLTIFRLTFVLFTIFLCYQFTRFCSDLNNHSNLVSLFERVCVFPGPGRTPQLQIVFNSPGPRLQFEFTIPGPKFVFACSLIYSKSL